MTNPDDSRAGASASAIAASDGVIGSPVSYFAVLLGIAAASVLIRVPFFDVPMISDEGGYAYVARFWSSDYQLYRDIPFYRPQAIFYLYQVIFASIGDDVFAIRLFAALYNAVTVVAVAMLARVVFSARVGLISAVIFAIFSVGPSMEGFTANAEIFVQLPVVLSALFAWRRQWAYAGLAAACAVLLKPSGVSALLLAVAWAFTTGASFRGASKVALVFGLGLLPSVLHGAWIGWEYYWDSMVTHRASYLTEEARALSTQWARLVVGVTTTVPSWGVPAALSLTALARRPKRPELFGILWLSSSFFGMAMGGFWFGHYFIQLLPPLALLGGAGLFAWPRNRSGWLLSIPLLLAAGSFSRDAPLWAADPDEISWRVYARPGYLVAQDVAQYIASNTDASDLIFVAFSEAEIYHLAERKASFPHMYFADFEYSQELFDGALESIRNREPAMVVVVQSPPLNRMSRDDFLAVLSEGYEQVHVVEAARPNVAPAYLFRRK